MKELKKEVWKWKYKYESVKVDAGSWVAKVCVTAPTVAQTIMAEKRDGMLLTSEANWILWVSELTTEQRRESRDRQAEGGFPPT